MNARVYKKIGVLGGMGPKATADYYMRVIKLFQKNLNAKYDSDFPEFVINSIPLPDVVELNVNDSEIIDFLVRGCKLLESAGTDFITIPCNTAHKYLDEMQRSVKIPILSIMKETTRHIILNKVENVLIMGTKMTRDSKLYDIELSRAGIKYTPLNDEDQDVVTKVIMKVLKGVHGKKDVNDLIRIINKYPNLGGVILACTELPIVLRPEDVPVQVFDTLDILAESAFRLSITQ